MLNEAVFTFLQKKCWKKQTQMLSWAHHKLFSRSPSRCLSLFFLAEKTVPFRQKHYSLILDNFCRVRVAIWAYPAQTPFNIDYWLKNIIKMITKYQKYALRSPDSSEHNLKMDIEFDFSIWFVHIFTTHFDITSHKRIWFVNSNVCVTIWLCLQYCQLTHGSKLPTTIILLCDAKGRCEKNIRKIWLDFAIANGFLKNANFSNFRLELSGLNTWIFDCHRQLNYCKIDQFAYNWPQFK